MMTKKTSKSKDSLFKSKSERLKTLEAVMAKADLHLKATAHHLVFGEGSPDSKIFFIGEAPGKNEDLTGRPFIGSAGKLLDELLTSINLNRNETFITSILKYRPPGNRNPTLKEIISHTPYLIDQLRIIQPRVIVPLGNFATRFVLAKFDIEGMSKIPGISNLQSKVKEITFEKIQFTVIPMYHPAAVLYNRSLHQTLKKGFQIIRKHSA